LPHNQPTPPPPPPTDANASPASWRKSHREIVHLYGKHYAAHVRAEAARLQRDASLYAPQRASTITIKGCSQRPRSQENNNAEQKLSEKVALA